MKMTLKNIISMYGYDPKEFRFVRHGRMHFIDPLKFYREEYDKFQEYQSYQQRNKFKNSKYIAVFASHYGTQAIFLGVWKIHKEEHIVVTKDKQKYLKEEFGDDSELGQELSKYNLKELREFSELSERLIIEWGRSTVAWVQKKDKEVLSILMPEYVKEFESYERTILEFKELKGIVDNPTQNITWINALKSVKGIYLITNKSNGKQYIGSAYGKEGILGRWKEYSATMHGNNKRLKKLLDYKPAEVDNFLFSILEILPTTSTANDCIEKEINWKKKLTTLKNGYNDN